ncbi:Smr/MutS family protein [Roseateles toxinivorans]|uniref:DNA-nicking Smr family endonuclease n=1 Tax=Roseateles toxinivorans TaxID=270368 RepID=A0A4R6QJJ6_9BURK|nr:Smr/MutS family protein [Roseateles toxinivorans]TDP63166.1 DNA-nicking Smr family endonuclease [Roseateles toxinivorans]
MRRTTPLKALQDLQDLKRTLAQAREEAAAQAAAREAERQRLLHEQQLFTRTVGPVTPLVAAIRAELKRAKPSPEPRQREQDEQQALRQALSDDFDVDSLLETDEALSFRRTNISQEVVRKLRRGHWSLQGQIDLHGLRRDEARESLGEFIHHAARTGMRCVRVVHGKGNGSPGREPVLKARVRRWLVQKQEVLAFTQARASEGGNGALIVLLQGAS